MSMQRKQFGSSGESLVCSALRKQGFVILARNYTVRGGELDIVARKKNQIVFVEVKTRAKKFFDLSSVITRAKQGKIIHAAEQFLLEHKLEQVFCSFDVALLEPNGDGVLSLTYLADAFQKDER